MNINLIKSFLPELIESKNKGWNVGIDIRDTIVDVDNEYHYLTKDAYELINEFLVNRICHSFDYKIDVELSLYKSVSKLKDGRFIQFQDCFDHEHDGGDAVFRKFTVKELLDSIKEVFPIEVEMTVYR